MQDFDFAQIQSLFPILHLNFAQILPKSNQICPNLIILFKKCLPGDAATSIATPAPTALVTSLYSLRL